MKATLVALVIPMLLTAANPRRYYAKITDRRYQETAYTFIVPGLSNTSTRVAAACAATPGSAACAGAATSTTTSRPAVAGSYAVTGATLSLQLADGSLVIANCSSKAAMLMRRNCRIPLLDVVGAEFRGDDAKLFWSVSIDGSKMQSETYKIIAVVPPRMD